MQKPKHLVRWLINHMDTHQKVFVLHTMILVILLFVLPIISFTAIQSSTLDATVVMFFSITFWKSASIVVSMLCAVGLMMFHEKSRQMIVAAFGVSDVFINFVCYLVIVGVYVAIGDTTMAVNLQLSQKIWLTSGYYIIGLWLALWLLLHASWSYKQWKKAHQATIINLAVQKREEAAQHHRESFKNLFD